MGNRVTATRHPSWRSSCTTMASLELFTHCWSSNCRNAGTSDFTGANKCPMLFVSGSGLVPVLQSRSVAVLQCCSVAIRRAMKIRRNCFAKCRVDLSVTLHGEVKFPWQSTTDARKKRQSGTAKLKCISECRSCSRTHSSCVILPNAGCGASMRSVFVRATALRSDSSDS